MSLIPPIRTLPEVLQRLCVLISYDDDTKVASDVLSGHYEAPDPHYSLRRPLDTGRRLRTTQSRVRSPLITTSRTPYGSQHEETTPFARSSLFLCLRVVWTQCSVGPPVPTRDHSPLFSRHFPSVLKTFLPRFTLFVSLSTPYLPVTYSRTCRLLTGVPTVHPKSHPSLPSPPRVPDKQWEVTDLSGVGHEWMEGPTDGPGTVTTRVRRVPPT